MSDRMVCPVWLGYFLASPLRKLIERPDRRLSGMLDEGMVAMDIGCGMGFYTLPMAKMVGTEGKVICVDLQEKMVIKLYKRAKKKNLHHRIEARVCRKDNLNIADLEETADFVLASAVVHEIPDIDGFFAQIQRVLKENGRLLVLEPRGHVSDAAFQKTISTALEHGLKLMKNGRGMGRRSAVFEREKED